MNNNNHIIIYINNNTYITEQNVTCVPSLNISRVSSVQLACEHHTDLVWATCLSLTFIDYATVKKRKKYGNVTHWHPLFFIGRFPDGPGVRQAAERPRYIDTARPVLWAALGWLFFVEEFSYPRGACVWWRGREAGRQARWYTLLPSRFRKGFCVCVLLPPTSRESFRKHIYISRKNSCIVHIFATSPHRYILYEINVSKRLIFLTLVFFKSF